MDSGLSRLLLPLAAAAGFLAVADEFSEDENFFEEAAFVASHVLSRHRSLQGDGEQQGREKRQRVTVVYQRDWARKAVYQDYWGPIPIFKDRQFERVFRVTRGLAEQMLQELGHQDSFFTTGQDCTGRQSIGPEVKLLMALKILAFGCSPSAFMDYFQMGESTGRECVTKFCSTLKKCESIYPVFMRGMTRADARCVSLLHQDVHGVPGMAGSLDCMHVKWKNCPVAWQGQFKGKEGYPTMILEALSDHHLWIWHHDFGHAGTSNDINVWDKSPLLSSFVTGVFAEEVDFDFFIGNDGFSKLWALVDGIYPEISRFVKALDEAIEQGDRNYMKWQERARKDVERAFGVLQCKFWYLRTGIEKWHRQDIKDIVDACICLHNMMVKVRVESQEEENEDWYDLYDVKEEEERVVPDPDVEDLEREEATEEITRAIETEYYRGDALTISALEKRSQERWDTFKHRLAVKRWQKLYNEDEHFCLRNAIKEHLLMENNNNNNN